MNTKSGMNSPSLASNWKVLIAKALSREGRGCSQQAIPKGFSAYKTKVPALFPTKEKQTS
jgi:hypothetical protein